MIPLEILKEKDRVQMNLSKESSSIREYLMRSHLAAKEIAASYGFSLQYVEISTPNQTLTP